MFESDRKWRLLALLEVGHNGKKSPNADHHPFWFKILNLKVSARCELLRIEKWKDNILEAEVLMSESDDAYELDDRFSDGRFR